MRFLTRFRKITLLWVIFLISTAGCSASLSEIKRYESLEINPPVGAVHIDDEIISEVIDKVEERNKTVEDDPEWIKRAYSGLMVRRLVNVPQNEYKDYKEYLDDGAVYIMAHPSFFPFFHYPKKLVDNTSKSISKENVVEKLLKTKPKNFEFAVLQAQERRTRDFIEFKSTQEKLIIVVVPRDYNRYTGYTYKRGRDEYMRYINEITNFSKSVLFAESRTPNRGYLREEDAIRLMEFLIAIDAKKILIGGGYVGRCIEDFYTLITQEYGSEGIFIVPELTDISPRELNNALARAMLNKEGELDTDITTNIMRRDLYKVQEVIPEMMNLE
jgi:hypothetical protein